MYEVLKNVKIRKDLGLVLVLIRHVELSEEIGFVERANRLISSHDFNGSVQHRRIAQRVREEWPRRGLRLARSRGALGACRRRP